MIIQFHFNNRVFTHIYSWPVLLVCLIFQTGCYSLVASSAYDPNFTFDSLRTYAWLPEVGYEKTGIVKTQPAIDQSIKSIIEEVVRNQGYLQVKRDPNFYLTYHAAIETKLDAYNLNKYYSSPYGIKNTYWQSWSDPYAISRDYEKGTLVIDIIHARSQQLIWRGSANANFFNKPKDSMNTDNVVRAARAILELFPPISP